MKRNVSVCAGVVAAVVAFSAGAEEPKSADVKAPETEQAAEPGSSRPDAGPAAVAAPAVDGPGTERVLVTPPLVDAAVGGAVSAAPAASPVQAQAAAPEAQEVHIPFSLSLVPGLSTSGFHTGNVVNTVSIGLVATHAKRVDGLAMSIGGNWVTAGLRGAQLAVGANVSQGPVTGTQLSVGGNVAGGDFFGIQSSVGVNVVRGMMEGAQLTVGANTVAGAVNGAQMSVGANVATGSVRGAQLGVGLNVAGGPVVGLQAAVGANVASEMSGLQMSSGVSYARHISGGQLSLINVGGQVNGAQVGLVNVAGRVKGAQVGLLNVAGHTEGESVGLLSFVGNGQAHVQVWGSDVSLTNVGLKLGGRHLYTLLTAGFTPALDGESRRYVLGAGFGGHIPLGRFYVDVDVVGSTVHSRRIFEESEHVLGQLRLMAGWQVARRFAVFGGVTANTLVSWDEDERWEDLGIGPEWRETSDGGRTVVRTWPGLVAGVQL
ncbi:LA_2272 family surface repeat-containing protein [Pyxidicoccus sp. 3LFB2]